MNTMTRRLRATLSAVSTASILATSLLAGAAAPVSAISPTGPTCPVTLKSEGSTTVYPGLAQAKSGFEAANTGTTLTLLASGSGKGLNRLRFGNEGGTGSELAERSPISIAASSRALSTAEKAKLYGWKIGADAFVILVSAKSEMSFISNITTGDVKGIWEGTITNWNYFAGGPNQPIVPRSRITLSGSYADFISSGKFNINSTSEANTITATGLPRLTTSAEEAEAANTLYQIVYTSLANLPEKINDANTNVKALTLNGIAPTGANVLNETYPLAGRRDLYLAMQKWSVMTSAAALNDSDIVRAQALVNYMSSSAGQNALTASGLVALPVAPGVAIPPADVNLDGAVGLADIGQVTGKWGTSSSGGTCKGWVRADTNADGSVGLADIGVVTGKWGQTGFTAPN